MNSFSCFKTLKVAVIILLIRVKMPTIATTIVEQFGTLPSHMRSIEHLHEGVLLLSIYCFIYLTLFVGVLCSSLFWYALFCVLSIVPWGSLSIYLCTIVHYINGSHASKLFNEVSF